ncbi:3-dehydroquinate synthase [Salicibibacter halophilus]|uniref:3-dehydroquinate synthase n=1 Tax=Salicibibacter halophilus TaxID=2502791 RepID=A0A514LEG6_9BACI|nr:3-dehydroquinate synthase [Salicibibacter halophilus]QDI89955.1 3-dehydroquinate synthase [Salicibibacter halophilus]
MQTIEVGSSSGTYAITVGKQLRMTPYRYLPDHFSRKKNRLLILADETVASYYLEDVRAAYAEKLPVHTYVLPAGEAIKSFSGYEEVLTACLEMRLDRESAIIALGGGVIGDLAGFVAATYMRGISLVQMPTTLLAHDSSIGGKTGINHPEGKNMIGAFHQPEAVIYDIEMLDTLPEKEWLCGFGELVKHGYIGDQHLLEQLKGLNQYATFTISDELLASSITVKKEIVHQDEREESIRAYLNFGHTLAHALEQTAGYGVLTHGEAVVNGMVFALYVGRRLGYGGPDPAEEIQWLRAFGYSFAPLNQMNPSQILQAMKRDKKNRGGSIRYVVLANLQQPLIATLGDEQLLTYMDAFKKEMELT